MEVATTTTEAKLSVINESLVQLSMMLGRITARQDQMLMNLKKTTAALAPTATTMPASVSGRVLAQQTTRPSSPSLFSPIQVVGAGVPHVHIVLPSVVPTRCSTLCLGVNGGSNHYAVVIPCLSNTEGSLLTPPELSLDKPLQSCIDLKFNTLTPTCSMLSSGQGMGSVDQTTMLLTAEVTSAVVNDPAEPLPILPPRAFIVFDPGKPTLTMCSTKCLDDDASRAMAMVSRAVPRTTNMSCVFTYYNSTMLCPVVPVCDGAEDGVAGGLFEEVLQHDDVEWRPWPPELQV